MITLRQKDRLREIKDDLFSLAYNPPKAIRSVPELANFIFENYELANKMIDKMTEDGDNFYNAKYIIDHYYNDNIKTFIEILCQKESSLKKQTSNTQF